jgi:hypothetical protein
VLLITLLTLNWIIKKKNIKKRDLSAVATLVEASSVQANCRAETTTVLPFSILSSHFLSVSVSFRVCSGCRAHQVLEPDAILRNVHFFMEKIYMSPPNYHPFSGWPSKLPMLRFWPPNYHFFIFGPHPSIYAVNFKQNSENTPPTL